MRIVLVVLLAAAALNGGCGRPGSGGSPVVCPPAPAPEAAAWTGFEPLGDPLEPYSSSYRYDDLFVGSLSRNRSVQTVVIPTWRSPSVTYIDASVDASSTHHYSIVHVRPPEEEQSSSLVTTRGDITSRQARTLDALWECAGASARYKPVPKPGPDGVTVRGVVLDGTLVRISGGRTAAEAYSPKDGTVAAEVVRIAGMMAQYADDPSRREALMNEIMRSAEAVSGELARLGAAGPGCGEALPADE